VTTTDMTVELRGEEQAQREAAEQRLAETAAERAETRKVLARPGGIAQADSPERIAKRIDRLSRYYAREQLPVVSTETPAGDPESALASALERTTTTIPAAVDVEEPTAAVVLERIINTEDFVDIRYLEAGVTAARAVCRVVIRDAGGRLAGYGSGSLVSPRLLLTNHHVLSSATVAETSGAEFNYQDGVDGQPLQPRVFRLDPATFYVADRERDFALVAVQRDRALSDFGFNRLIEAEGKAILGEYVTIVQHPRGEKKRVALRENQIVTLADAFVHYAADTEPGSSGSPVFNDQWEVVALHHASVRAPEQEELGGFLNEGIRISRIIKFLRAQELDAAKRELVSELLEPERIELRAPAAAGSTTPANLGGSGSTPVEITVPLEVTIRVGGGVAAAVPPAEVVVEQEAEPDPPNGILDGEPGPGATPLDRGG
jgi:endonuclease G, mitochondrial